jgi:ribosomal 50S subunit-recycling heat shock protein
MTEQIKKTITTEIDDIGKRLDIFLSETEEELTRSQAQKLLQDGFVLVNGALTAKNYKLRRDDIITLTYPAPVPCRADAKATRSKTTTATAAKRVFFLSRIGFRSRLLVSAVSVCSGAVSSCRSL